MWNYTDGQCSGLDAEDLLFYVFRKIQGYCNICLSQEETKASQGNCDRVENILDNVVDDFSTCVLNICAYDCPIGGLIVSTDVDDEYCGCNVLECDLETDGVNQSQLMIVMVVLFVVFGWI